MTGRDHGAPCVSWWGDTDPVTGPAGTSTLWAGVTLSFHVEGFIEGFRRYIPAGDDGGCIGILWDRNGPHTLAAFKFRERADLSQNAWHQSWIHPRIAVDTNGTWALALIHPNGKRFQTSGLLNGTPTNHNDVEFFNGFTTTSIFPPLATLTLGTFAPGVDVLFRPKV